MKHSGEEAPQSLKQQAYQSLRQRILADGFAPGALIDDSLEAQQLGMSRTPVREALLLLEAEGLVEMLPRRAVRVVPITDSDIQDITVLLTALETTALALIAEQKPQRADLEPLTQACQNMHSAIQNNRRGDWLLADEAFHRGLLTLSGNRHLAQTGIRYRDKIQRAHFVALRLIPDNRMEKSTARHEELIEMLLSDHPEAAIDSHNRQRREVRTEIIETLARAGLKNL